MSFDIFLKKYEYQSQYLFFNIVFCVLKPSFTSDITLRQTIFGELKPGVKIINKIF